MVSVVLSIVLLVSCVALIPTTWAEDCTSYWDDSGVHRDGVACDSMHCCGSCHSKYCCNDDTRQLTREQQEGCDDRSGFEKHAKTAILVGSILGSVIPFIFCVGLCVCFLAPCCFLYKKCRKRQNPRRQNVPTSTFIAVPQQPPRPAQHPLSHPSYQPVPVQPGYGGPTIPTAPPPPAYMEAAPPAYPQPAVPPHPGQHPQPPYNPSYGFMHT